MSVVVFERFRKEIFLHAFENFSLPMLDPPLILGIYGPAGDGKSCQVSEALLSMRLDIIEVPTTTFEDKDAGEPAKRIEELYDQCVERKLSGANPVIVINDFDAAVGNFDAQYTVNMQHLFSTFMGFSEMVRKAPSKRVPIIVTGNNLGTLYAPLRRSGRMRLFKWVPNIAERKEIVRHFFPFLSDEDCLAFINACNCLPCDTPLAFYADLRGRLLEDHLWDSVKELRNPSIAVSASVLIADELKEYMESLDLHAIITSAEKESGRRLAALKDYTRLEKSEVR